MKVKRLHIWMDGLGWSEDRDPEFSTLIRVDSVAELPRPDESIKLTVLTLDSVDDIDYLTKRLGEIRCWLVDAHLGRLVNRGIIEH